MDLDPKKNFMFKRKSYQDPKRLSYQNKWVLGLFLRVGRV